MSDALEELRNAKDALTEQRRVSRIQARQFELDLNRPAEAAVDAAVRAAFEADGSRSAIAKVLGESRVTVNERLNRAYGSTPVPTPAAPRRRTRKAEVEPEPVPEVEPYSMNEPHGYLMVNYNGYGPDGLAGQATFEVIRDEDSEEPLYWFLSVAGDNDTNILEVLDTRFEGWYYEDAHKYVKRIMGEQGGSQ